PVYYDIYGGDKDKYIARHIIMDRLEKTLDGDGISPSSNKYVHLICTAADPLMLNIARQAALLCHFPNFDEEKAECRTRITILSPDTGSEKELRKLYDRLSSESIFGNLLTECQWSMSVYGKPISFESEKKNTFIDVEIEVVGFEDASTDGYWSDFHPDKEEITTIIAYPGSISDKNLTTMRRICHQVHIADGEYREVPMAVDMRMARRVNIVYRKGTGDRNIFNDNPKDAKAYSKLLRQLVGKIPRKVEIESWENSGLPEINQSSNLCCSDCFPYYLRSVMTSDGQEPVKPLIDNIAALSRAEHARWNVEKLIMGFRSLTPKEILKDELLTGSAKSEYRKRLKSEKIHIDLCPMHRLVCIDPESLKYASFIILAIPAILDSLKGR
ncbi:MAG: hypothetical protein K2O54_02020, partial [Prevotella sp.]|nr:hypothetical protein [Prevotella sp.]